MPWQIFLTALFTVLPIAVILWYFYTRDVNREPRVVLVKTFLLGLLGILPLMPIAILFSALKPASLSITQAALYEAFLIAAIPEEAIKLLVIRGYSARNAHFDEPMDGIVYGVTAALGFAALENVFYVLEGGLHVALLRSFTAVPLHVVAGAILGNAVAQAKFGPARRGVLLNGFANAVALHGLYDFALMAVEGLAVQPEVPGGSNAAGSILGLIVLVLILLIGSFVWLLRTVRRLRSHQLAEEYVRRTTRRSTQE